MIQNHDVARLPPPLEKKIIIVMLNKAPQGTQIN